MTQRISLDELTSDALDQLYTDLEKAQRQVITWKTRAGIRATQRRRNERRAEQAERLLGEVRIEAATALVRADDAEVKLAAVREDRDRWREQAQTWRTEAQDATQRAEQAEAERDRAEAMVRAAAVRIAELETPNTPTWRTRAERAEAALERVRDLHKPWKQNEASPNTYCAHCEKDDRVTRWPCPTIRALNEHQEQT